MSKNGLVLEGGGMRGLYTCGILDTFMEKGIDFDGAVGISAGACFGCNLKSRQPGRALRYNRRFAGDKRFCSFRSWIMTGDIYNAEFCYKTIPQELDPFDFETLKANPMEFYMGVTDMETGKALFPKFIDGNDKELAWMLASASMPLAARIVEIDGGKYMDGGIADSIPVRFFESIGYKRNLIVLTQPKGFVKKKNKMLPVIRARYLRYPAFVEAVADRHERYNETLDHIAMLEQTGKAFVIRPPIPLEIGSMERDPVQLRRVYETGRAVAEIQVDKIAAFVNESKAAAEE